MSIEDRTTIPVANQVMVRMAAIVIGCQALYGIVLFLAHFVRVPVPFKQNDSWMSLRYTNTKWIWVSQVALSFFSIYQAICCVMASITTDPYLCNVFWQNCMFGMCCMLYSLYTFLLLKDLAVEYGRSKSVLMFHQVLMVAIVGLIPVGALVSFWGLYGKVEPITNSAGEAVLSQDYCVLEFELWSLILVPSLDMGVTACCLFLFVQPLLAVKRQAARQLSTEHQQQVKILARIINENVIAGFISVFLTAWIFVTIFISKIAFKKNLAHIDCVVAVTSGLINAILSWYTTRRGWRLMPISD